jgi:uncharacterized caspase-like protein
MPDISMSGCPDIKLTVVRNANQLHPGLTGIKGERGMRLKRWLGVLGLAVAALSGIRAEAEPRIALVIGNANYAGETLPKLDNPINDARLMTETLKQVGFEVASIWDANQIQMKRAIIDFGEKVAMAGPTATAVFYYAGHGVQSGGKGFLIPIGAEIEREVDLDLEAIHVNEVALQLAFAGCKTSILMLDAGRNNPLSRGLRSASTGLAEPLSLFPGMFISYASAPGSGAADGVGPNSPYAAATAKAILIPGLSIHEVFERVRAEVSAATRGQTTVDTSTLDAPFYFLPKN